MNLGISIDRLLQRRNLEQAEAYDLMRALMSEASSDVQIAGVLVALNAKGCTGPELAGFASALREEAITVAPPEGGGELVDTCGTGGGAPSFNLSTAAAIVASAAGARVAKHGNRAVTSSCGSADVLEACGVRISSGADGVAQALSANGIVFLFAPAHHPLMKRVGPVRRELGVRTVFNQLGPLLNPAQARRQLIGVYDASLLRPMAEALELLGTERALVVHGDDGLDEISPCVSTRYVQVWEGELTEGEFTPLEFGQEPLDAKWIMPGKDLEENAALFREAISNVDSPRSWAPLPNAGATLWLAGLAASIEEGAARAREAVGSGAAARKLEAMVEASQSP
jgi:anthranilate phosphoribosyltransferase